MNIDLHGLITDLSTLDWDVTEWERTHWVVERLLEDQWNDQEHLFQSLGGHLKEAKLPTITRTAELHSWLLHDGGAWCLKLNQFKPSPAVGKRSENIHDHTRPLTSLTMCGRYTQDYYYPVCVHNEGAGFGEIPNQPGESTAPGHVYTITPSMFHALNWFEDGTLTLCVYGPIVKDKITVFNTVTGLVEKRTTCDFAKGEMINQLLSLEKGH